MVKVSTLQKDLLLAIMQRQGILSWRSPFRFTRGNLNIDDKLGFVAGSISTPSIRHTNMIESCQVKSRGVLISGVSNAETRSGGARLKWSVNNGDVDELFEEEDDDDECCPVDCVREFTKDEEFLRIMEKAKKSGSLVVVDFYRTSCGSCKYIEKGFSKLCKGSGDQESPVIFLKHNVLDEYDEQSEVAERLRIRTVPLFHFYKNGVLLEAFPTRDKDRILSAILKYSSPDTENTWPS
ncbi:unnamed protein product [Cuscuta epithymum]|uniref:Thioredoxin domain-containing protein n=2 Tax=Cuscuta epithymum TaxID=186058 RepID=A0AAV0CJU3_9ASTE|nr:unnamed protein product [Cuscuta epithymum]